MTYNPHINMDSFGDNCPLNWEEIADYLNDIIDEMDDDDDLRDRVADLWERYCNGDLNGAPEPVWPWYAVCADDDNDHGTGSFDLSEAIYKARAWNADPDMRGHYVVVKVDPRDDFCLDVIDLDEEE